jgi:N-acetylmuramoyl-L-alanine amidase
MSMRIALDIGHANGTGARGNGLEEHAVAKTIVCALASKLSAMGHDVTVIDFPEMSNRDDLNATVKAANSGNYNLGVSIHCDCSDSSAAKGGHVCYFPSSKKGKALAEAIAKPLSTLLPGRANTTVERGNLAVLKQTNPVWVLCECGFISNEGDAQVMKDNPGAIAEAIAQGIKVYLDS